MADLTGIENVGDFFSQHYLTELLEKDLAAESKDLETAIDAAQKKFAEESDSVGQKRMSALHKGGSRAALTIAPNLWAGIGLVRGGAGTALVGTPAQVAERLREYQALGIDTIIASGYPHLEEAYKVAELLFPALGITANTARAHATQPGEFGVSGTGIVPARASAS